MKLQRQLSRKVGKREYDKWVLVVPPEVVKEVGWEEGEDVAISVQNRSLVLKKMK